MSKSTYVALAMLVAVSAACSAAGDRPRPSAPSSVTAATSRTSSLATPTATAAADCLSPIAPTYLRTDGPRVALSGSGPVTVVLSDESDETDCAWLDYAQQLESAGYRVALYDYVSDPVTDLIRVAAAVRAHGGGRLVLLGASEGAKASILAAARIHPAAVVSISAEATLGAAPVAPAARRLTAPTLYATSTGDPYGSAAASKTYAAHATARVHRLVTVPGTAHGTALLDDARVAAAVLAFLTAVAAPSDPSVTCGAGAQKLALAGPPGFLVDGLALGSGSTAVVFLHELGQAADECGWWPYAYWLTHHYRIRAVLVNRCDVQRTQCPSPLPQGDALVRGEVQPAVAWARAHGAKRVVLVGASAGGGDALEASAVVPGIDAVVDLSGDQTSTLLDVQRAASRVRVPTFMAVATHDADCPVPGFRRQYAAVPAATKRLVVVGDPLGPHGWDLVFGVGSTLRPLATTVADWIAGHYR